MMTANKLLNHAHASYRPAYARFLKVAVKWLIHGFLNIAERNPFTPLNSRYLLNNPGSQQAKQSASNCIALYTECYFCVIFQVDGCNNFTEICKLFTVS